MSSHLTPLDISTSPELLRLVEEVATTKQPRELKRDNQTVAVLMPVAPAIAKNTAKWEKIRATFGSWSDLDADELIATIHRWRRRIAASNTTIMNYLLDTDWIINLLAGNKDAEERIQHLDPEEIVISLATVGEIYEGAYSYANPQAQIHTFRQFLAYGHFLRHFHLLTLNDPIIEQFAEVRS